MNPLQAVFGGLLLFGLPGYALLRAVLPDARLAPGPWHAPAVAAASVLLSTAVLVLVGGALGFLGLFRAPILTAALLAVSALLLATAWRRGAFSGVQRAAAEAEGGDRLQEAIRWKARAESARGQGLTENADAALARAHALEREVAAERFDAEDPPRRVPVRR